MHNSKLAVSTIIIILASMVFFIDINGQPSFITPSPNSLSTIKFINVPVNNYTGIANIAIPLCNFKTGTINVPIKLNYHASGIKVQDVSGWVGLGWNLNAGGVITRMIKGIPDEDDDGYCGINNRSSYIYDYDRNINPDLFYQKVGDKEWDSEPDIFYFSFLGRSGRFVLNRYGDPILIPEQNLKLSPAIGPKGIGKWIITDETGMKFYFGETTNSIEETQSKILPDDEITITGVTSWYLTKVESSNGAEVLFSYLASTDDITYNYYSYSKVENIDPASYCSDITDEIKINNNEITIKNPKYLNSISSTSGSIQFSTIARADIPNSEALQQIEVRNISSELVKSIFLEYDYFSCANYIDLPESEKKLKLSRIVNKTDIVPIVTHKFTYNEENTLAARLTWNYDHWGFFNNYIQGNYFPEFVDDEGNYHSGANRETDVSLMKLGILERIDHVTGGYTEFEYEANEYYDNGIKNVVGGARISAIKEYTKSGLLNPSLSKYFNYNQSGQIFKKPLYAGTFSKFVSSTESCKQLVRYSHSVHDLFDMDGSHIGYSHVTVSSNNGSEEFYYSNFSDYPDEDCDKYNVWALAISTEFGATAIPCTGDCLYEGKWRTPFPSPNNFRGWNRGLLTLHQIKDNNETILRDIQYKYSTNLRENEGLKGLAVQVISPYTDQFSGSFGIWFWYHVGSYNLLSARRVLLEEITENKYFSNGQIRRIANFEYNAIDQIKTRITSDNSGDEFKTEIKYPMDFPDNSVLSTMVSEERNMLNYPIETVKYKNDKAIQSSITSYKFSDGEDENGTVLPNALIVPFESYALETDKALTDYTPATPNFTPDPRCKIEGSIDKYDTKGNILQTHKTNGRYTSYLWAYNKSYPVAKIENASFAAVETALGSIGSSVADIETKSLATDDETQLSALFEALRGTDEMANALITSYTYDLLIGIKTETEANGKTIYYEYDALGRLKTIRNADRDILKDYTYQYKGQ